MYPEPAARPAPWTSEDSPEGARPAATLIVVRDRPQGDPPEVLMLQRAASLSFGGAIVFPGGRVDPGDHLLAERIGHSLPPADAAARVAAIRETIEEAGIAVGLSAAPPQPVVQAMRGALHAGATIGEVLSTHGLSIDLGSLTSFARWCPWREKREDVPKFFDTRFYVARAPETGESGTADETEHTRLRWASAAQILADCDKGSESAVFPTLCNLERLALFSSHADVVRHAQAHPVEMATTWIEMRDGAPHLCIPDHLGYPVPTRAMGTLRRF